jgi:Flp pilus assembly protein TadB
MSRYTTETPSSRRFPAVRAKSMGGSGAKGSGAQSAGATNAKESMSLIELLRSLPDLFKRLVTAELDGLKVKASHIGKNAGIGAGLVVVALMFLFFALGTLVAVGILALALVMPAWLAALIVFVVFLLIAGVLVLIALRYFRKISEGPNPSEEIQKDIRAVKGVGEYDRY